MTSTERHYRDMLLRWLQMKRDMPWNTEPEPPFPDFTKRWKADLGCFIAIRRDVIHDFTRTA